MNCSLLPYDFAPVLNKQKYTLNNGSDISVKLVTAYSRLGKRENKNIGQSFQIILQKYLRLKMPIK